MKKKTQKDIILDKNAHKNIVITWEIVQNAHKRLLSRREKFTLLDENAPKNIVITWEIVQNAHKRYNYPGGKSLTITLKK